MYIATERSRFSIAKVEPTSNLDKKFIYWPCWTQGGFVVPNNVSTAARWRTKLSKIRDQGYIKAQWRADPRYSMIHVRTRECVQMTTVSSTTMIQKRMEQRDAKSKRRRTHERIGIALPLILRTSDRKLEKEDKYTREF